MSDGFRTDVLIAHVFLTRISSMSRLQFSLITHVVCLHGDGRSHGPCSLVRLYIQIQMFETTQYNVSREESETGTTGQ